MHTRWNSHSNFLNSRIYLTKKKNLNLFFYITSVTMNSNTYVGLCPSSRTPFWFCFMFHAAIQSAPALFSHQKTSILMGLVSEIYKVKSSGHHKKMSINRRVILYKDLSDQKHSLGNKYLKLWTTNIINSDLQWSDPAGCFWNDAQWHQATKNPTNQIHEYVTVLQSPARNKVNILEQLSPVCLERLLSNCLELH